MYGEEIYDEEIFVDKVVPRDNEEIEDKRPKIKVYIKSKEYRLKSLCIKMYLDNKEVAYKVDKEKIKYTPKKRLDKGEHEIAVIFSNNNKTLKEYRWKFFIGREEKYNYYRGNLHSHTSYSSGQGTPMEAFKCAKNNGLDFLAVTDHFSAFKTSQKWEDYKLNVIEFNKKNHKNLALCGLELSVKGVGHLNIFNYTDPMDYKFQTVDKLYNNLKGKDEVVLCINHPGKNINNLKDKLYLNEYIRLIEVGNGSKSGKYNRYEKQYYKMLDCGWKLGAVNGQDNHKKDWGKEENTTVVIAKNLTEDGIMEALLNRRTYSTESKTLKLDIKANGCFMGSILDYSNCKFIEFSIKALDEKYKIEKVQIVSNNGKIIDEKNFLNIHEVKWKPKINLCKDNNWYVVKVIQEGDKIAFSSPIFFNS